MTTISVRLGKEIARDLTQVEKEWHTDRSEVVRRLLAQALGNWKVQRAVEQLQAHKISIGRAAKECGLSIWEMMELAKVKNIDWTGYDEYDLERDLKHFQ